MEHKAIECEMYGEAKVLATLTYPYTKPGERVFSAIHSNPPGIHTQLPAAIEKTVGKGKILWVAMPLELTAAHNCRKTIYNLIGSLVEQFTLSSNAPSFVEVTKWQKADKQYLGVVNQQPVSPIYPIHEMVIELPYACKQVEFKTPAEKGMEVTYEADKTIIKLPPLQLFHIIELITE